MDSCGWRTHYDSGVGENTVSSTPIPLSPQTRSDLRAGLIFSSLWFSCVVTKRLECRQLGPRIRTTRLTVFDWHSTAIDPSDYEEVAKMATPVSMTAAHTRRRFRSPSFKRMLPIRTVNKTPSSRIGATYTTGVKLSAMRTRM